ncbi:MAG TPA: hypothetical protein PLW78_13055 [bacterium]|nr:hypothetical protein [bacterium]
MKRVLFVFLVFGFSVLLISCSKKTVDVDNTGKADADKEEVNDSQTGDTGDTGNTGDTGDSGDTGNSGNTGDTGDTGDTGNTADSGDTGSEVEYEEPDCESYGMTDCLYSWIEESHCLGEKEYVYCEEIDDPCESGARDVFDECSDNKLCGECAGSVECIDEAVFNEQKKAYESLMGSWIETARSECGLDNPVTVAEEKKLTIVFGDFKYGSLSYKILSNSGEEKWSRSFCMININYSSAGNWTPEYSFNESDQLVIANMDKLNTGTNTLDDEIMGFCKIVFDKQTP